MKKYTKILALALAVAMMLGMTAMAGTPYFSYDFASDTVFETWRSSSVKGSASFVDSEGNALITSDSGQYKTFDFGTLRNLYEGSQIVQNGTYWHYTNNTFFPTNTNGNVEIDNKSTTTQNEYMYVPALSWNGEENIGETYVVSYDFTIDSRYAGDKLTLANGTEQNYTSMTHFMSDNYYVHTVWGYNKSTQKYTESTILGHRDGSDEKEIYALFGNANEQGGTSGIDIIGGEDVNYGTAYRHAVGFKYDSELGHLVKRAGLNGETWYTDGTFGLENVVTVDGITFPLGAKHPKYGKIRMYVINDAEGLVATSDMDGETGVLPSTRKVTINFNNPVGAADVAVTANGIAVEGVTTKVVEVADANSIASKVELTFPADLTLGTTYAIDLSGVTNELGEACVSNDITFETLEAPVANFVAYEGLDDTGSTTSDYAGKTVYVKATATNSNNIGFNVKLIIGIYDEDGNLVKYASATKALAASGSATFGASFKLAAGQTIRAEYKY